MNLVVSLSQTATSLGIVLGIVSLIGAVVAHYRWVRPRYRAIKGEIIKGRDSLIGRDAVVDSITGKEIAPALPGLGVRMDSVEDVVKRIATVMESQQAQDHRIEDHEDRIKSLELGAVERVFTKAESTAAWRAVEAVANGGADDSAENPELG